MVLADKSVLLDLELVQNPVGRQGLGPEAEQVLEGFLFRDVDADDDALFALKLV